MKQVASRPMVLLLALLALLSLLVLLGSVGPASSAKPAGPSFKIALSKHALHSGERLTVTATSTTQCEWLIEWDGTRRHATRTTFVTTFVAPAVTRPRKITLHALCVYDDGVPPVAGRPQPGMPRTPRVDPQAIVVTIPDNWQDSTDVNVLPEGGVAGEHAADHPCPVDPTMPARALAARCPEVGGVGLPDTGGPSRWLAALGVLLVLVGAQLIRRDARRSAAPGESGVGDGIANALWLPTYRWGEMKAVATETPASRRRVVIRRPG